MKVPFMSSRIALSRMVMRSRPFLYPGLLQSPDQLVDAVLAEERLAAEHHHRHAPMAGRALVSLALLDDRRVAIGIGLHGGRERAPFQAGALRRSGQVVALVPVVDLATPDHLADLAQERQPAAAFGSGDAEMGQAVDV